MNLQFDELAGACYKQWKLHSGEEYQSLKAIILDTLKTPYSGLGDPHPVEEGTGDFWTRTFGNNHHIVYRVQDNILQIKTVSRLEIPDVVHTDDKQHEDELNLMRRFMDNGKPKLGIFWYNYLDNILFGVEKGDAELYTNQGRISTYPKLHKSYWQKMHNKAIRECNTSSIFYNEHDYTQIPRGRIFLENGVFYVNVGDWIDGTINGQKCIDQDKLRELIIDEFNLPEDFQFRQDEHWNIGHGWSEDRF